MKTYNFYRVLLIITISLLPWLVSVALLKRIPFAIKIINVIFAYIFRIILSDFIITVMLLLLCIMVDFFYRKIVLKEVTVTLYIWWTLKRTRYLRKFARAVSFPEKMAYNRCLKTMFVLYFNNNAHFVMTLPRSYELQKVFIKLMPAIRKLLNQLDSNYSFSEYYADKKNPRIIHMVGVRVK